MDFHLEISRRPGAVVVAPVGDLDVYSAEPLREALTELTAEDTRDAVVIDLAGSDFIDSSALGVLVGTMKKLAESERRLAIASTKPHLVKILRITRLTDVIPVGHTVDAVLEQ
ncbi:STAS domain-containing protein [uncultured Jatrophihabitans sp.]|uniref:STAS domain-containing protein n=1 Tax=uncultured Jatrophihabitans sp. TaxID=1610747 RepID=UPI0035CA7726